MSRLGHWIGSIVLVLIVLGTGGGLAAWKHADRQQSSAASANQPEPTESVTAAIALEREHRRTTTSIGTILALRSISVRNELPGTVHQVKLTPGEIVELEIGLAPQSEADVAHARRRQLTLAGIVLGALLAAYGVGVLAYRHASTRRRERPAE